MSKANRPSMPTAKPITATASPPESSAVGSISRVTVPISAPLATPNASEEIRVELRCPRASSPPPTEATAATPLIMTTKSSWSGISAATLARRPHRFRLDDHHPSLALRQIR